MMAFRTENMDRMSVPEPETAAQREIPLMSGALPGVGHLMEFRKDPVAMLARGYEENGELFKFRLGPKNFVLFSGPDAHDVYFKTPEEQLNAKVVYKFTVPIFGPGVAYDASPEIMAEQLAFLFPALKDAPMRRYVKIMFDEASAFADSLGESGDFDLPHEMNELTVKIASRCLIGQEIRDQVNEGFAETYHELQGGINTIGFFFPHIPIKAHRIRDRARKKIVEIFSRIMSERRRTSTQREDFMQALMEAKYEDGSALSDDEITGLLLTVLFAGQHTTAILATWTLLELIRQPSYIERIRDEIQQVYGESGTMDLPSLKRQPVLERAVREGERMHPPLIMLVRKVLEPMSYKDYVVPAGTLAMVAPAVAHRLEHIFSDPHQFNPDRHAPPASEGKKSRYSLITFGGGKHRCMGEKFAYIQMKAIWSVLFDRFDFEFQTSFPEPDYGSWVTGPHLPCRVRYHRRSGQSVFR